MKIIAWTLPASLAFSAFCFAVAIYNAEAERQEGLTARACIQNGGEWSKSWSGRPVCSRPNG